MIERVYRSLAFQGDRLLQAAVMAGAPPALAGHRCLRREQLEAHVARVGEDRARLEVIHATTKATNPLPRNVVDREILPKDAGWWGYSFYDVPERVSGPTLLASLREVQVIPQVDGKGQFWVFLQTRDQRALELREMAFRPLHVPALRTRERRHLRRARWVLERSYHNYSHWLTAHLPKLLLLRQRGELEDVYLTAQRPRFIDDCLRLYGFDPGSFPTFDPAVPLAVEELEVLSTDRFRPELLQSVRQELPLRRREKPWRKVFISRQGADRRRLINEAELWPKLERRGFQSVLMEDLSFAEQVRLMQETRVLLAPHGAGLTNMLFCAPESQIVELADLSFPNPNFYAVASAMKLHYWLVPAEPVGQASPLERDLRVQVGLVVDVVEQVLRQA